jgi:GT2 family glycosyltransferase
MSSQVTLVVVPRERFSFARRSLTNIFHNTKPPFDLIYVDVGGPAPLRMFLEEESQRKGFRIISLDRYLSPNRARNLGWREVKTKYTVFIDNDALVKPGWLEALVRCADETAAWIVGPLYLIGELEKEIIHLAGGALHLEERDGRRILYDEQYLFETKLDQVRDRLQRDAWDYAEFHCMLVRTDVLQRLGPLDENLLSLHEHIDFSMAVRQAGGSIYIEPRAVTSYVPSPPYEWSDLPYFMLRWSEDWNLATVRHFNEKWGVSALRWFGEKRVPEGEETIIKFARGHRRFMSGLSFPNGGYLPILPREQAELMVALFLSVDRDRFDVGLAQSRGDLAETWSNLEAQDTFDKVCDLLSQVDERGSAIFIRPVSRGRPNDPTLVCIETGEAEHAAKLRPLSFMTIELAPGRYQFWIAVDTGNWRNAAGLRKLVPSARIDASASQTQSAYLLAGSCGPGWHGARVKLVEATTGRVVSLPQLERAGLGAYLASAHRL